MSDELRQAFKQFDTDGDGYITLEEARVALNEELGLSASQTQRLLRAFDRNCDGKLSYEEFIWLYRKLTDKKQELEAMFKRLDKDRSGTISLKEATVAFGGHKIASKEQSHESGLNLSSKEIEMLLKLYDTNGDGSLQFEEFAQFWSDVTERRPKGLQQSYCKLSDH